MCCNTIVGENAGNLTMGGTASQAYHSSYNTFMGTNAGSSNTTGYYNTFIGTNAGYFNTTGVQNTFMGTLAGYSNTTGYYNTLIGTNAGSSNTTGYYNTFMGTIAGYYLADGSTSNQTSANSVFVGFDTKAAAVGGTNEIVIGYSAIGNGSNSVTLGN